MALAGKTPQRKYWTKEVRGLTGRLDHTKLKVNKKTGRLVRISKSDAAKKRWMGSKAQLLSTVVRIHTST